MPKLVTGFRCLQRAHRFSAFSSGQTESVMRARLTELLVNRLAGRLKAMLRLLDLLQLRLLRFLVILMAYSYDSHLRRPGQRAAAIRVEIVGRSPVATRPGELDTVKCRGAWDDDAQGACQREAVAIEVANGCA